MATPGRSPLGAWLPSFDLRLQSYSSTHAASGTGTSVLLCNLIPIRRTIFVLMTRTLWQKVANLALVISVYRWGRMIII